MSNSTSTSPFLLKGGQGYSIPVGKKPTMKAKPELLQGLLRMGGGGGGSNRPAWMNKTPSVGVLRASQVQAALTAHKLASMVGDLASLQVKSVLQKAFLSNFDPKGKSPKGNVKSRQGRVIKSGTLNTTGGKKRIRKSGRRGMSTSNSLCRWNKFGLDKGQLDAELEEYAAEREKNSLQSLDAQLDRYNAQAAAARKAFGGGMISDDIVGGGGIVAPKKDVDEEMD